MKARRVVLFASLLALFLVPARYARAQQIYTWTNGSGDFQWNAASINWTGYATTWTNDVVNSQAVFGSSGTGAIGVDSVNGVQVSSITFNAPGYTLSGGAISLGTGGITDNSAGTTTISSAVSLRAPQTWTTTSGGTLAVGGVISGSYALSIGGAGTLTLSTNNTYTGATTVNGGVLQTSATNTPRGTLGTSSSILVNSGGTISVGGDNSLVGYLPYGTQAIQINAGGAIVNTGSSTNALSALVLNGGTLAATTPNALYGNWGFGYGVSTPGNGTTSYISGGNAMLAQAGAVFNVGLGDTLNVSAVLADQLWTGNPGLLVKTGSGTLLLTGSNTYTGGTTISAGTLQLGDGTSGNDGAPGTGSVTNNAALVYNLYGSQTPSYAISGSGNLIKAGPGTLTLSTNNTCTGATTVNGGVLQTSGPNTPRSTLGTSSSILVNSGGTISVGGDNSLVGYQPYSTQAIQINAGGAIVNTDGTGIALSALVLNGGTLAATTPNALYGNWGFGYGVSTPGNGTTSYISGGNAMLAQAGAVFNVGLGDTLNVSAVLADQLWTGNPGLLVKTGSGTLLLTGSNTYTGGTTINAGTLQLGDGTSGNDGAPGTGSVTNNAALVYNLYGSQTPSYAISGSGNLIKAGPGTLTLSTNNTCTGATTVNGGVLQTSGPNTPRSTLGTSSSILVNSGGTISVGGDNSLVGYLPYGTQAIQINAGGAIVNTGSSANALSALVLNGGTLAATTPNALYGNWGFGYGVSTPGNGTTSYISGGNAVLTQGGGTVFNVGVGDTLNVSTILAHTSSGPDTGLSKTGPGLLVLTATNTYTGNTVVSAGTLVVNGAINGSSQVFAGQGSGGVLSGSGTIANQVVVQSTCGLLPGNLTGGGTLTAGSALLNPTSTVYYTLSSVAGNGSFFSVGRALDLSNLSTAAGSQATLDVLNGASLGSGTYSLIGYGSLAASWNSGVFTLAGLPAGDHYSLFETGTGLGAGTIELSVMAAATGVVHGSWSSMTSGVWTDTTKWTGGNVPGTSGSDTAVFATQPASGTSTVTLDSSRSLASLGFSSASATGYVIAASSGNTLTLAGTGSSAATISNSGGSQTINAPIVLGSNLSVAASPNSVLTIAGSIEETGNQSLSVSGGGELILSGTNSYTGGTTVNGGTLSVASAEALPTSGVLVVGRSGRVVLGNILGASEVLGASQALAATPALSSVDSSVGGRDSSPPNFAVQSSVPVAASASGSPAAVPEPGTVLLLLVGAAALAAWRRRSTASGTRG